MWDILYYITILSILLIIITKKKAKATNRLEWSEDTLESCENDFGKDI